MNFKDIVAEDNLNVFINFEEFGELRTINSNELLVVIDYDNVDGPSQDYHEGVFLSKLTIYVREADLGYVPEENQLLRFGTASETYPYIVTHTRADMGILEIRLEANKT